MLEELIADLRGASPARAVALIRERTGRRWIGIYAVNGETVRNLAWSGPAPPAHPSFPAGRGLTGAAISSRQTVVSNDVSNDPRYLTNQQTTGSELIVPIVIEGAVVGTLDVEAAERDAFGDEDRTLFEAVAAALAGLYDEPRRP